MTSRISNLGTALLFLGWALCPAIGAAQSSGKSAATPPTGATRAASSDPADDDQEYVFSTQIQIVTVPVTVTNSKKQFVTDLDKREFTVLDNGQAQRIENFELAEEPLSLAIVVETSSRVQTLLPELRTAGGLIADLIVGETGEAALITFDREVKIEQDFTQDSDQIQKAMKALKAGADQTHLSDAVAKAMFLLQQRPRERRKVIIILSEARDLGSKNKFGLVLRSAQQLGISVYSVGLSTLKALFGTPAGQGAPSSPYPPGVMVGHPPGNVPATPDAQNNWGAANVNLLEIITDLVTSAKSRRRGKPAGRFCRGHRRRRLSHRQQAEARTGAHPHRRGTPQPIHAHVPAQQPGYLRIPHHSSDRLPPRSRDALPSRLRSGPADSEESNLAGSCFQSARQAKPRRSHAVSSISNCIDGNLSALGRASAAVSKSSNESYTIFRVAV